MTKPTFRWACLNQLPRWKIASISATWLGPNAFASSRCRSHSVAYLCLVGRSSNRRANRLPIAFMIFLLVGYSDFPIYLSYQDFAINANGYAVILVTE